MIGGLVVVEKVFNWPGMGTLAFDAISARDYPVLQASVTVLALLVVFANLLVDLAYGLVDPRIRNG
jgi:peptide/nickel transport system permease protein